MLDNINEHKGNDTQALKKRKHTKQESDNYNSDDDVISNNDDYEKNDTSLLKEKKRKSKRLQKRKKRSRNAFVEAFLDEGSGGEGRGKIDDDYAELEDFIVCADGKSYK